MALVCIARSTFVGSAARVLMLSHAFKFGNRMDPRAAQSVIMLCTLLSDVRPAQAAPTNPNAIMKPRNWFESSTAIRTNLVRDTMKALAESLTGGRDIRRAKWLVYGRGFTQAVESILATQMQSCQNPSDMTSARQTGRRLSSLLQPSGFG